MPRNLRKSSVFASFLLLALVAGVGLFETRSGAANARQTPTLPAAFVSNASPNATSLRPANAVADGEVQAIITTYKDGRVLSQVITDAGYSGAGKIVGASRTAASPARPAAAGDIVVSQIYGSGGNPGSTYQNSYLELFNRTENDIDFGGWPIYFTSATGTFDTSVAFVSSRGIFIGSGQYILIQFGDVSSNGAPLPNPDFVITPTVPPPPGFPPNPPRILSPSGKVFISMPGSGSSFLGTTCPLPNSQIVDFVGYGSTANCFEGAGPVATLSNTTAALRQTNGCTDTDNNASDLVAGAPNPRNSSSTRNFCSSAPPKVQFSPASISVTENTGSFGLLVTRTGNTSGVSTVDYATTDNAGATNCNVVNGNASSRCDYIATIGTLQFAAGETFKLIAIPVIDDAYSEGTENFSINLSNPTGATIGAQGTMAIVLNDNDNTNGTNPIDQSSFFVRQHYLDFLNREPDNSGNNFWIGEIENCTPKPQCTEIKRINVSGAFFLSIEFHESGYLAYRAYKAAYGDGSGSAVIGALTFQIPVPIIRLQEFLADSHAIGKGVVVGVPGYEQVLENNKIAYFAAFVARQRFLNDYPLATPPATFVDRLNMRAGNVLTTSERDTLANQLETGQKTRAEVVRAVAENGTLAANESNRAFVLMQYFGYLRRNPNDPQDSDYTGYNFWLTKLNEFHGNFVEAEMVKAFINSSEYRQRFGP